MLTRRSLSEGRDVVALDVWGKLRAQLGVMNTQGGADHTRLTIRLQFPQLVSTCELVQVAC